MSSPGKRKKSTGLRDIQFYHRLTRCGVAHASSRVSSAAPWLVGRIQRPVVPGKANRDSELAVHLALDFLHEPDQLNARKHKPPSETETTSTLVRKTRRPPGDDTNSFHDSKKQNYGNHEIDFGAGPLVCLRHYTVFRCVFPSGDNLLWNGLLEEKKIAKLK